MYNVDIDEGVAPQLDSFAPSAGQAFGAAVSGTFNENPTVLGYDFARARIANRGEKLPKEDAEATIKQAGVKLKVPEGGYTKEALDILVKRQQDQRDRQSIIDRTPWSWVGSPVRGAAQLLTGIVDPLNVASAFIPVIGEARAASMLGRAGASAISRAGARATIGGVEGVVGAAALEPIVYGLHTQLQDDYHMTDSLINLGFGGLFGAGLHVAGGAGADVFHPKDPYARFSGLDAREVRQVLDYESAVRSGEQPDAASFTTAQRRAAGLEPPQAWKVVDDASPEGREVAMRSAVADMSNGRVPEVTALIHYDREANFKTWFGKSTIADTDGSPRVMYHGTAADVDSFTPRQAGAIFVADHPIVGEAYAGQSAKWMAENGKDGAPNITPLYVKAEKPFDYEKPDQVDALVDKAFEGDTYTMGDGRKALVLDGKKTLYSAGALRLALADGQWQLIEKSAIQDAIKALGHDSFYVHEEGFKNLGVYDPKQLKSAIGNSGAFDPNSSSLTDAVRSAAERQQHPDSVALGSPEASKAADQRIADAPKEHAVETAEAELTEAMSRLKDVQRSLELSGASPEKISKLTEGLKAFDEAIKDAVNIGKALVQNALCGIQR